MEKKPRRVKLEVDTCDTLMEGADMRALALSLSRGQSVPWHYHTEITEIFFCLMGAIIVETRAPNIRHELAVGESCTVPAMTAHRVYSKDDAACRFLVLEGIGCYDSLPVGDST